MHAPTVKDLFVIKQILHYLKGSIGHGILMRNKHSTKIFGYADADYAGNAFDRKSTQRNVHLWGKYCHLEE